MKDSIISILIKIISNHLVKIFIATHKRRESHLCTIYIQHTEREAQWCMSLYDKHCNASLVLKANQP